MNNYFGRFVYDEAPVCVCVLLDNVQRLLMHVQHAAEKHSHAKVFAGAGRGEAGEARAARSRVQFTCTSRTSAVLIH